MNIRPTLSVMQAINLSSAVPSYRTHANNNRRERNGAQHTERTDDTINRLKTLLIAVFSPPDDSREVLCFTAALYNH